MFLLYNLLLAGTAIIWLPWYLIGRRRRGRAPSLLERLGRLDPSMRQTVPGAIWLHAVSVGEVISCRELVGQLRTRLPRVKLFVSTSTATGRRMAEQTLGSQVDGIFYAPLDLAFAVRRVLGQLRPCLVVVAETEIWPNLFRETRRFGAGLVVVNARISDRSAPRYRRLRFFFRRVLSLADAILTQSALDRRRLIEAGAPPENVEVGGNLKFDVAAEPGAPPAEVMALIERLKPETVVVAGSTRENEEEQVMAGWRALAARRPRSLLILAPRHAERFDAVAQMLAASGSSFLRRSRLGEVDSVELPGVLLLDSLGELAAVYAVGHAVFVGGSLVNWGGHNVLEPAFAGRAVIVGPHMQNFRAIAAELREAGGLLQVSDAAALGDALVRLIENPTEAGVLGERARRWAGSHRGAARRMAERAAGVWHGAVPNLPPRLWQRWLLWIPAGLWEAAARLRAWRAAPRRLGTLTVSVGNLSAGGTGKTPLVLWLIEQLERRGLCCAVLTRGYRRAVPEAVTVLEPGASAPASVTGDEAQLYLRHTRAALGIAADRYRAGAEIERRFHPDVLLLDDGFQHLALARDLDLVVIDATAPFGGGALLPALLPLGRLREPLAALARADAFILTRCDAPVPLDGIERELRRHNPRAPIWRARTEAVALVDAATGQEKPLGPGRAALAFCGIGNPGAFFDLLARSGVALADRIAFPDHHRYSEADVGRLRAAACPLVTTEKDVVNLGERAPQGLHWLRTRLVIEGAEELLDRAARVRERMPAAAR